MLIWECGWGYSQFSGLYRKAGKFTGQFIMKTEGTVYVTDVMQSNWAITVCIRPQGYLESWLGEKDRYELEHALQQLPLWQATSYSSNESNREHLSLSSRLERKLVRTEYGTRLLFKYFEHYTIDIIHLNTYWRTIYFFRIKTKDGKWQTKGLKT